MSNFKTENPFEPKAKTKSKTIDPKLRDKNIQDMFDAVNEWLDKEGDRHFNPDFFDSLYDQWVEKGTLSEKQVEGLANIYRKWVCQ